MTKAQEIYDKVEALVAKGTAKSDAFRQVAEEYGQPFNSMRGAYYAHARELKGEGAPRRTRKRETTTADAVESAVLALRRAVEAIDAEVLAAKVRADEAQAEYESLRDSADGRKSDIKAKITALES